MGFGEFGEQARQALASRLPAVMQQIREGTLPQARAVWHPYGYIALRVALIPEAKATLVLHVWPRGLRGGRVGLSPLHCHSFNLYSRVLAGIYRDRMFRVIANGPASIIEQVAGLREPLRSECVVRVPRTDGSLATCVVGELYHLPRRDGSGPSSGYAVADQLVTTHTWSMARAIGRGRELEPGDTHAIPVHEFHAASIPLDSFCATLSVRQVVVGADDRLIGRPNLTLGMLPHRQFIDPRHFSIAMAQLRAATASVRAPIATFGVRPGTGERPSTCDALGTGLGV